MDPKKANELLRKLLSYEPDIDKLFKLVEVFNPHHDKQSKPLQCAVKIWALMQIDMKGAGRGNYLTRSKKMIADMLENEEYSFSKNIIDHISSVANSDSDRDAGSIIQKK